MPIGLDTQIIGVIVLKSFGNVVNGFERILIFNHCLHNLSFLLMNFNLPVITSNLVSKAAEESISKIIRSQNAMTLTSWRFDENFGSFYLPILSAALGRQSLSPQPSRANSAGGLVAR